MTFKMTLAQAGIDQKKASSDLVLTAARKVLLRDGPYLFSLRAVARELHCSPGTIYNYYADKDALIAASTNLSFSKLSERLRSQKAIGTIEDQIRSLGQTYIEFGLSNQEDYAIAFTVPVTNSDAPHEVYYIGKAIVVDAISKGELFGTPDEIVQQMWMPWHGVVSLLIQRPSFPWVARERLISAVIESVVHSLPTKKPSKSQ